MITRNRNMLSNEVLPDAVRACVREFLADAPRLKSLRDAYDGRRDICERERAAGLPNNRLVHDFPRYICTMAVGYLIGNPVQYEADDAARPALDALLEAYRDAAADSVDVELARSASLYGRGVELVFMDEMARPRTAALDPRRAFVVYDDTVENRPICGIRLTERTDALGQPAGLSCEVFTELETIVYDVPDDGGHYIERAREAHWFPQVPMVEYWNGEDERGDFEGVLTLIDAYDRLQSDRMNDKAQFVDALLILSGCTMEPDEYGRSPGRQLREDKVLVLPDSDARAEWLCKQLSETDTEVLKKSLAADIHKLSLVPDLSDARFSGYESGVAMRYKLLGLEQLTRVKERWFREGLRRRMDLFAAMLAASGSPELDGSLVRMSFTRSVPVDPLEQAQTAQALTGIVPDETLRRIAMRAEG